MSIPTGFHPGKRPTHPTPEPPKGHGKGHGHEDHCKPRKPKHCKPHHHHKPKKSKHCR
jgi:hypothetical protein